MDSLTVINLKRKDKNMKKNRMVLFAMLIVFVASGCSTLANKFGPEESMLGGDRVTSASANQMFNSKFEGFDDEQLIYLLDPVNHAKKLPNVSEDEINKLRAAFYVANKDYGIGEAHRSQIQDRLIAASNQRCNIYTTYLKRLSTKNNAIFGTLTTVLGGAGAIVTGAHTARLLSGLAGISSGTRAELNQAIFESVATSVIVPAIQKQRAEILEEILSKRVDPNKLGLAEYTIEGAIADAIRYHGACSMDAGISFAQRSIQSFDNVGIKEFKAMQTELHSLSPFISIVVAKELLEGFAKKINGYKERIEKIDLATLKPEQKVKLKELNDELVKLKDASEKDDGEFYKKAVALDEELKKVTFEYSTATDKKKSEKFEAIKSQQKDVRELERELDAKDSNIRNQLHEVNTN